MCRVRLFAAVIVAAIVLGAVSAAGASASKLLVRTEEGGPVASLGAEYFAEVITFDGGCEYFDYGHLVNNSAGTDKLTSFGAPASVCLEPGYSISGSIKEAKLSAKGTVTLAFSPKLALEEPGPCIYYYGKLTVGVSLPTDLQGTTTGLGKLSRKASLTTCAPTTETSFSTGVYLYGELVS